MQRLTFAVHDLVQLQVEKDLHTSSWSEIRAAGLNLGSVEPGSCGFIEPKRTAAILVTLLVFERARVHKVSLCFRLLEIKIFKTQRMNEGSGHCVLNLIKCVGKSQSSEYFWKGSPRFVGHDHSPQYCYIPTRC